MVVEQRVRRSERAPELSRVRGAHVRQHPEPASEHDLEALACIREIPGAVDAARSLGVDRARLSEQGFRCSGSARRDRDGLGNAEEDEIDQALGGDEVLRRALPALYVTNNLAGEELSTDFARAVR